MNKLNAWRTLIPARPLRERRSEAGPLPVRRRWCQTGAIAARPRQGAVEFRAARLFAQLAFTRAELLILIAAFIALAAIVLPTLANSRPHSHRVICANNLRQIGVAMRVWGDDHGDQPPHHLLVEEGGTKRHPLAANTWLHFSWISNELASPKLLFCPSDTGTPANDFTGNPASGYVHPNFANRATSYWLTFTFSGDNHRIQVGDRNIRTFGVTGSSYFNTASYVQVMPIDPAFGWTAGLHEYVGNLLFADGQVEMASNQRLREVAEGGNDIYGAAGSTMKFCIPR